MKTISFHINTFGCRLNQAESANLTRTLLAYGLVKTDSYLKAKLVIVNSCAVTAKTDREVKQWLRRIKRDNPSCFLVLTGCGVSHYFTENWSKKGVNVDLTVTNDIKDKPKLWLPEHFKNLGSDVRNRTLIDKYHHDQKALIKIQDGCRHFCSYCIVPYVRPRLQSVPYNQIITNIKREIADGTTEIILTGVDLASYRFLNESNHIYQEKNTYQNHLVRLIGQILGKTTIKKVSFGSISLSVFDNDFFNLYRHDRFARLTTHFHIPLQSGSESVLIRMRRPYTAAAFLSTLANIKNNLPQSTFSTDIIVGFPGETSQEYQETIVALRKIKKMWGSGFTKAHLFRYSMRKSTLAYRMIEMKKWSKVSEELQKKRLEQINQLVNK